jgi:hypothetical protein
MRMERDCTGGVTWWRHRESSVALPGVGVANRYMSDELWFQIV